MEERNGARQQQGRKIDTVNIAIEGKENQFQLPSVCHQRKNLSSLRQVWVFIQTLRTSGIPGTDKESYLGGGCDEWVTLQLSTLGLNIWIWTLNPDKLPGDWKGRQNSQDVIERTVQAICLCYCVCTCGRERCACHDVCGEVRGQAQGSGSPVSRMYARLAGPRGSLLLLPPIPWNTGLQTWATALSFACVLAIQTQVPVLVQQAIYWLSRLLSPGSDDV